MADANEPLSDYVDKLIRDLYVRSKFSGVALLSPSEEEMRDYIEDEDTGRPHPIEDAADHYLLRAFDVVRRDMLSLPLPERTESSGEKRHYGPGWYRQGEDGKPIVVDGHLVPHEGPWFTNETHGEIPWRCFHGDPDWPCTECGHHPDGHIDSELCTAGAYLDDQARICYPCNCGNNIGR